MSAKDKVAKAFERIVCGKDEAAELAEEIRKAQEEADKKEGKQ
jgi:hypothetical protein